MPRRPAGGTHPGGADAEGHHLPADEQAGPLPRDADRAGGPPAQAGGGPQEQAARPRPGHPLHGHAQEAGLPRHRGGQRLRQEPEADGDPETEHQISRELQTCQVLRLTRYLRIWGCGRRNYEFCRYIIGKIIGKMGMRRKET